MPGTFLYRETASAAQTIIAGIQLPPLLRVENGGFVENGLLAETHFLHTDLSGLPEPGLELAHTL